MGTVGQTLIAPETGWRRYDDTDSRIIYNGTWVKVTSSSMYNGSNQYTQSVGSKIQFKFFGTKLRIISYGSSACSPFVSIAIDSVTESFSEKLVTSQYQTLVYEKTGLSNSVHTVVITSTDTNYTELDAIDIDDTGYLVHPILNQVSSLDNMKIGDCIPCQYKNSLSGGIGYFHSLGYPNADEIPIIGSATPNGSFNFIKVDKGLYIGDRAVQHTVLWDTLNSAGYMEGTPMSIMPLMTSNVMNGITISASSIFSAAFDGYVAFNKIENETTCWATNNTTNGWLQIQLPFKYLLDSYFIVGSTDVRYSPKDWQLQGSNDGVTWDTIDSRSGITWNSYEKKFFDITSNGKYYSIFRIVISANNGGTNVQIVEMQLFCGLVRSLSGGVAYADVNDNCTTSDNNLGAWTTNNEFDKYILGSNLNNKITPGDTNIWHHADIVMLTICKDTPILALNQNTYRTVRRNDVTTKSKTYVGFIASNTSSSTYGFRPVMQVIEDDIKNDVIW